MARETKVGLLVGMGVILLIGIIVSDHLAEVQRQNPADMVKFAADSQEGLLGAPGIFGADIIQPQPQAQALPPVAQRVTRQEPLPLPGEDVSQQRAQPGEASVVLDPRGRVVAPQVPGMQVADGIAPVTGHGQASQMVNVDIRPEPQQPSVRVLAKHTVRRGDTLYKLARQYYGNGEMWQLIREANPSINEKGQLSEGQSLMIPHRPDAAPADTAPLTATGLVVQVDPSTAPGAAQTGIPVRLVEVGAGQTLTAIAQQHLGNGQRWDEILAANKDQLRRPEDLKIGMKLRVLLTAPAQASVAPGNTSSSAPASAESGATIPAPVARRTYTVQAGDSLYTIAAKNLGDGSKWRDILSANKGQIGSVSDLKIGQQLILPATANR